MKTVTDLSREELIELKQDYLIQLANTGEIDDPSWAELADADKIVPDEVIIDYWDGVIFTEDDFICDMKGDE